MTIDLNSETNGGTFEAFGCLPATALMAAKLGSGWMSDQSDVGILHPSASSA